VRELKNVMARANLLAQGDTIRALDLGLPAAATLPPQALQA
jgi:DNA-binding NtrC family response regulator